MSASESPRAARPRSSAGTLLAGPQSTIAGPSSVSTTYVADGALRAVVQVDRRGSSAASRSWPHWARVARCGAVRDSRHGCQTRGRKAFV